VTKLPALTVHFKLPVHRAKKHAEGENVN
jgi:hypothetical protein